MIRYKNFGNNIYYLKLSNIKGDDFNDYLDILDKIYNKCQNFTPLKI